MGFCFASNRALKKVSFASLLSSSQRTFPGVRYPFVKRTQKSFFLDLSQTQDEWRMSNHRQLFSSFKQWRQIIFELFSTLFEFLNSTRDSFHLSQNEESGKYVKSQGCRDLIKGLTPSSPCKQGSDIIMMFFVALNSEPLTDGRITIHYENPIQNCLTSIKLCILVRTQLVLTYLLSRITRFIM